MTTIENPHQPPNNGINYHLSDYYQHAQQSLSETGSAPPDEANEVEVWHSTDRENLGQIAERGLLPFNALNPNVEGIDEPSRVWVKATAWLDGLRPPDVPVSLQESIFAQPQGGHILDVPQKHGVYANYSTPSRRTNLSKEMLSIDVSPETAYVVPGLVGEAARRAKVKGTEDATELGLAFWKDAMSLKRFLELYDKHETDETLPAPFFAKKMVTKAVVWRLKDSLMAKPDEGVPYEYDIAPEVIVPVDASGGIKPSRLHHFASSVIHLYAKA